MKKLDSSETELIGSWIFENGKVVGDEACERIEWLATHYLKYIARTWDGWTTLFQDPEDGRYWERTYPQGHLQGGGPPSLKVLTSEQARAKYQLD